MDGGYDIEYSRRDLINNMFVQCQSGFYNNATLGNPLKADFNLFYESGQPRRIDTVLNWGEHNLIDVDPMFIEGSYQLNNLSPAKDGGDPEIRDLDGSRSDIGIYGGPYAYPPP